MFQAWNKQTIGSTEHMDLAIQILCIFHKLISFQQLKIQIFYVESETWIEQQDGTIPWTYLLENFLNIDLMWELEKDGGEIFKQT